MDSAQFSTNLQKVKFAVRLWAINNRRSERRETLELCEIEQKLRVIQDWPNEGFSSDDSREALLLLEKKK